MVYSNESINEKAEAKELRYDYVRVVKGDASMTNLFGECAERKESKCLAWKGPRRCLSPW